MKNFSITENRRNHEETPAEGTPGAGRRSLIRSMAMWGICLLLLTGCVKTEDAAGVQPSRVEQDALEGLQNTEKEQQGTAEAPSLPRETEQEENSYSAEDTDRLLGEADAQGGIVQLTENGCLFEPYIVSGDGSTIMAAGTEGNEQTLEEVTADDATEYILVTIDSAKGTAVSAENADKAMMKEGESIYIYGEKDSENVWKARKIILTVMM